MPEIAAELEKAAKELRAKPPSAQIMETTNALAFIHFGRFQPTDRNSPPKQRSSGCFTRSDFTTSIPDPAGGFKD
jgi:hypothetical protein